MRDGQIEIKRLGWVGGVREKEGGGGGWKQNSLRGWGAQGFSGPTPEIAGVYIENSI